MLDNHAICCELILNCKWANRMFMTRGSLLFRTVTILLLSHLAITLYPVQFGTPGNCCNNYENELSFIVIRNLLCGYPIHLKPFRSTPCFTTQVAISIRSQFYWLATCVFRREHLLHKLCGKGSPPPSNFWSETRIEPYVVMWPLWVPRTNHCTSIMQGHY